MKFYSIFLFFIFLLPAKYSAAQSDSLRPKIAFDHDTINYGNIPFNSDPYRTLKVYNTGKEPLLVHSVTGDVVIAMSYSTTPILPGQSMEIRVMYPTNKSVGRFINFIAITSNATASPKIIIVKGNIIAPGGNSSGK